MSENKINDGDLFEDYLSQSINWFTNALRLENDDSFADLQIKCLQSYLSTCFDNLNTNNGMPTTSTLNGHRKLMIAINDSCKTATNRGMHINQASQKCSAVPFDGNSN